jgi:hypothetical protein
LRNKLKTSLDRFWTDDGVVDLAPFWMIQKPRCSLRCRASRGTSVAS